MILTILNKYLLVGGNVSTETSRKRAASSAHADAIKKRVRTDASDVMDVMDDVAADDADDADEPDSDREGDSDDPISKYEKMKGELQKANKVCY
jgi:hypothetical protein